MAESLIDREFNSVEDARAFVEKYNKDNFTNFVISNNNKRSLVYHCRHAVKRKSVSHGQRPNQHYNYVGCTATIRMYKSKNGTLKITNSTDLNHKKHIVSKETYPFNNDTLNEEERLFKIHIGA